MLRYQKATTKDIELLTKTRITVLRAANKLSDDIDMSEVEKKSHMITIKMHLNMVRILHT